MPRSLAVCERGREPADTLGASLMERGTVIAYSYGIRHIVWAETHTVTPTGLTHTPSK